MKSWFLAIRPWSFTAACIPIILGTALAIEAHYPLLMDRFILTLFGGVLLQAGTNLLNTWSDYVKGIDTIASAHSCPELVTGAMRPEEVKRGAVIAFACAALIGGWLTYDCGPVIALCGIVGVIGAYGYTGGPLPYKYRGFGTLFVFFLMGPLMVWPAYYIQTGDLSFWPVLVSLPIACLVAAILHANDLRDLEDDREAGICTFALFLGLDRGMKFYFLLYFACFLAIIALITVQLLPLTAFLTLLLIPSAMRQLKSARIAWQGDRARMILLVKRTAAFHGQLGFLLSVSIVLNRFFPLS